MFWLDGEGHLLSAGPTETVRGPDGLYTVSSTVTVEKRHGNTFTHRVQQKTINQTRETQIQVPGKDHLSVNDVITELDSSYEQHVVLCFTISDHFSMVLSTPSSPASPGSPGSLHVIIGSIISCAALVSILAVGFVVWKWRIKKISKLQINFTSL